MTEVIKKGVLNLAMKNLHRTNGLFVLCSFFITIINLFIRDNIVIILIMSCEIGLYTLLIAKLGIIILKFCVAKYNDDPIRFKCWRYGLSFGLGLIIFLILSVIFTRLAGIFDDIFYTQRIIFFILFPNAYIIIVLVLHDYVIVRETKNLTDLKNYQLEIKKSEAENLLLKQQIQPHFLFNALSTLKVLYKTDQEKGEHYLLQLSDFLRVSISHNNEEMTTLKDEVSLCLNYLEMQKIRFGDSLIWELKVNESTLETTFLPSFSLQPLVENAIKHNHFTKQNPLLIAIRQNQDSIEITNNINTKEKIEFSTGIGLSNLSDRFLLLTGKEIIIKNDGNSFNVSLNLIKNENNNN
ncbi:hypothetical protein DI487_01355 [Flavobacterium sediminis]|uniref:Signal transduction histidine kinase internal region domain-containing protein n=1 Tax=Flavobacterium sediminis TaxID=2201181 RepID=A0A2U8QR87_9FLAO|nr:histidine kinase [Flavobacterium sediminis]AWM12647.1 hypothetical protein DI487_01355 [Flavobacterium sediminis]